MLKNFCTIIFVVFACCFGANYSALGSPSGGSVGDPSIQSFGLEHLAELQKKHCPLIHAKMSASAYLSRVSEIEIEGYRLRNEFETSGFKVLVFDSLDAKDRVFAFRGSEALLQNWLFNFSHVGTAHLFPLVALGVGPAISTALWSSLHDWQAKSSQHISSSQCISSLKNIKRSKSFIFDQNTRDRGYNELLSRKFGIIAPWYHSKTDWLKPASLSVRKSYEVVVKALFFKKSMSAMAKFINEQLEVDAPERVYFTGHSLGGFLAQHFAALNKKSGSSFNAPDLGSYSSHQYDIVEYQKDNIFINYRLQGDFVSIPNRRGNFSIPITFKHQHIEYSSIIKDVFFKLHSIEYFLGELERLLSNQEHGTAA